MIELPKQWFSILLNEQETGMGYYITTIALINGERFDRVVIDSGFITKVYGYETIPFNPKEISKIIVTHDKWDFSTK